MLGLGLTRPMYRTGYFYFKHFISIFNILFLYSTFYFQLYGEGGLLKFIYTIRYENFNKPPLLRCWYCVVSLLNPTVFFVMSQQCALENHWLTSGQWQTHNVLSLTNSVPFRIPTQSISIQWKQNNFQLISNRLL